MPLIKCQGCASQKLWLAAGCFVVVCPDCSFEEHKEKKSAWNYIARGIWWSMYIILNTQKPVLRVFLSYYIFLNIYLLCKILNKYICLLYYHTETEIMCESAFKESCTANLGQRWTSVRGADPRCWLVNQSKCCTPYIFRMSILCECENNKINLESNNREIFPKTQTTLSLQKKKEIYFNCTMLAYL